MEDKAGTLPYLQSVPIFLSSMMKDELIIWRQNGPVLKVRIRDIFAFTLKDNHAQAQCTCPE